MSDEWDVILRDMEADNLPQAERARIAENYYSRRLTPDMDADKLPDIERARVRENLLATVQPKRPAAVPTAVPFGLGDAGYTAPPGSEPTAPTTDTTPILRTPAEIQSATGIIQPRLLAGPTLEAQAMRRKAATAGYKDLQSRRDALMDRSSRRGGRGSQIPAGSLAPGRTPCEVRHAQEHCNDGPAG